MRLDGRVGLKVAADLEGTQRTRHFDFHAAGNRSADLQEFHISFDGHAGVEISAGLDRPDRAMNHDVLSERAKVAVGNEVLKVSIDGERAGVQRARLDFLNVGGIEGAGEIAADENGSDLALRLDRPIDVSADSDGADVSVISLG